MCTNYGAACWSRVGISRRPYEDGDAVPLYTNKITSDQSHISFAYNELSFICPNLPDGWGSKFPQGRSVSLNFGELLRGDRILISDYQLEMGKDVNCLELCTAHVAPEGVLWAKNLVSENYMVEWSVACICFGLLPDRSNSNKRIVDNLPGSTSFVEPDEGTRMYSPGFKLGEVDNKTEVINYARLQIASTLESVVNIYIYIYMQKVYLNNHVSLLLRYRKTSDKPPRKLIVGFEIYPARASDEKPSCQKPIELSSSLPLQPLDIKYTYSVFWKEDETIEWSSRWERFYRDNVTEEIKDHWIAILNSGLIALGLTGMVGTIMARTLSRDIQKYNAEGDEEGKRLRQLNSSGEDVNEDDIEDVTGWKLVHGDVFRPPPRASIFAPLVGSGAQLWCVCVGLLIFSAIGVLNPSYRGGFVSFGLFLFFIAGYVAHLFPSLNTQLITFLNTQFRFRLLLQPPSPLPRTELRQQIRKLLFILAPECSLYCHSPAVVLLVYSPFHQSHPMVTVLLKCSPLSHDFGIVLCLGFCINSPGTSRCHSG